MRLVGKDRKNWSEKHCRLREDQQEHQQQMMEILEKVSDQMQKVENICSGSAPVLEGEYYTPPVSQTRITTYVWIFLILFGNM